MSRKNKLKKRKKISERGAGKYMIEKQEKGDRRAGKEVRGEQEQK